MPSIFHPILQDEVRSSSDEWSALGMRGNQSSPVVCEGVLSADRLIGSFGESKASKRTKEFHKNDRLLH